MRTTRQRPILVVDDDVVFRRDVCEVLGDAGHETIAASNGRDAMAVLASGPRPSAIVLDLDMPEVDGFAFTRWLDRHPSLRAIPVVVVSGLVHAGVGQPLRCVAMLDKPFSPDELIEHVEKAVSSPPAA